MTVTADPPTEATPPDEAGSPTQGAQEATSRRQGLRRLLVWCSLGVLAALLAIPIVEDPIAHVWFQSRQGELASEHGSIGTIADGRQVGVLGLEYPPSQTQATATTQKLFVVQGDSTGDLRAGPGHQPESAMFGQRGNAVVFGHRHDWGAPFASLDRLKPGGQVFAQNVNASQSTLYTIKTVSTVVAGDTKVLAPTADYQLTLVTDAGGRSSGRWLVVTAVSGTVRPGPASTVALAPPSRAGVFANGAFAALVLSLVAGAGIVIGLRNRARSATVMIMLVPLAMAFLLAFVLELDLIWMPLA